MNNRLYFMDLLRSFTIFLVVIFHLTLLYTEFTPVQNPVPEAYNGLFMGISSIINGPLLNSIMFFVAGFFAFSTYRRKGGVSFLKDKFKKLGIPYLGGLIILAPLTQYIANHSWGNEGRFVDYLFKEFFLPKTITPHHLWFIGILLFFFIISVPFFKLLQDRKNKTQKKRSIQYIIMFLFLLGTFFIYFVLNFFYKPYDFISLYIINFPPAVLPVYAAYFALGIYASFQKWFSGARKEYIYPWIITYVISLVLYIGTFIVIPTAMETNHPLLAVAFTVSLFSGVMSMVTIFKRFGNKNTKFNLLLSRNGYGSYIIHYFIVFLTVYLMRNVSLPVIVKYIIQCIFCPVLIWSISWLLKNYTPLRKIL